MKPSSIGNVLAALLTISLAMTGLAAQPAAAAGVNSTSVRAQISGEVDLPTPTISGTLKVGKKLTVDLGGWESGDVKVTYQWYRGRSQIPGATKSTYTLKAADRGKKIKVSVADSLDGYQSTLLFSKFTGAVTDTLTATPKPTIGGALAVGKKLTAKPGTWKPEKVKFSYQWYRGRSKISGATKSTYTLKAADRGKKIKVKVTGKKAGYTTVSKTSKATVIVKAGKITGVTPKISGTKQVGKKLTAKPGAWKPKDVKFSYQWYRGGSKISGATKSTYTLKAADRGKRIKVKVTGKKAGYTTVSRTSKATVKITYPSRTKPASRTTCPAWAPIKGNESSMIYHMKGQRFYTRTHPEDCFRTESAAKNAGYRKSKV